MQTKQMPFMKLNAFSLCIPLTFSLLFSFSFSDPNANPDVTTLLAFKLSSGTPKSLPWTSESDPCSWLGVTCHPATHRVIKLILNHLNLTGSIQILARLTHLRHLSLHHNHLSSAPTFTSWINLKHLYLSHNRFSGTFPSGISNLYRLVRLDISYNQFSGQNPVTELTQLPHLLTLRLEFNSFTGTLNSSSSITIPLIDFDVSGNDLTGKIPNFLSKFPATSFAGNFHLCGKPLSSRCYNRTIHIKPRAGGDPVQIGLADKMMKKKVRDSVELMIIGVDVAAVIATLVIVAWCCYSRRYRYIEGRKFGGQNCKYGGVKDSCCGGEMVRFEGCKGFDKVEELLMASAEMLGKGSVGTTYKVVMDGGDVVVVVKRVRVRERRIKKKEIDGVLRDNIGGLRNPNILSLRAFSCSRDELFLVYDFLPNGSLYNLLHGKAFLVLFVKFLCWILC